MDAEEDDDDVANDEPSEDEDEDVGVGVRQVPEAVEGLLSGGVPKVQD